MYHSLYDFRNEVIDAICELDGCNAECAYRMTEEKYSDVEYGHRQRLSPSIIAGAILGINDCCIARSPSEG